jgi:hypothetical protein
MSGPAPVGGVPTGSDIGLPNSGVVSQSLNKGLQTRRDVLSPPKPRGSGNNLGLSLGLSVYLSYVTLVYNSTERGN